MTMAYEVLMPLAPWECPDMVFEALESIFNQTLLPRRLIISCDGEPALELRKVIDSCSDMQGVSLAMVVGPGQEGVGLVLARGLLVCETELVIRADADDISRPERASRQVEAMEQRPDLAALSSPIQEFIDPLRQPLRTRLVPVGPADVARYIGWRNPMNHPSVIFRRSRILQAGNYQDCPGFEDYHLWLRLHKRGDLLDNLSTPLVLARVGSAHLGRRRGYRYAWLEARFLVLCGRQALLPWTRVVVLILSRCTIRLLPATMLRALTHFLLRSRANP